MAVEESTTTSKNIGSQIMDLHDQTWASLSKAKSVATALIADDHISILREIDTTNLIAVIEDLIDSAMCGVEQNWEIISRHLKDAETSHD